MKRALVFSESGLKSIKRNTLPILDKLTNLKIEIEIDIVIVSHVEVVALELLKQYQIKRITLLKGDHLQDYSPETYTNAVYNFIQGKRFDLVFAGSTAITQDIFPRLCSLFDSGLATTVKDFYFKEERLFGIKEVYGGKCLVDIELLGAKPWFMTFKSASLNLSSQADHYDCEIIEIIIPPNHSNTTIVAIEKNQSERPPLDSTDIVVAGGRGLGNEHNLSLLEKLADTLGAALGASGGAVGNDFAPKDSLVGQTGTQISPLLYIACGISGAIQHLAGIRNAQRIVAINPDANTPLMRMADFAIVGKLEEIVPELTQQIIKKQANTMNQNQTN